MELVWLRLAKTTTILWSLYLIVFLVGCSSGVSPESPIIPPSGPVPDRVQPVETSDGKSTQDRELLGIWRVEVDLSTFQLKIIPQREAQPHLNITNMLLPPICNNCLKIDVTFFDPVSRMLSCDVTLRNPYPVAGRDVRGILFTDAAGHMVLNPDGWTALYDIPGGIDINPFVAFAKDKNMRIFSGSQSYEEKVYVYIPKPAQYDAITFAVDGTWPGNCSEPYAIENFEVSVPMFDAIGSTGKIKLDVRDWQDDVTGVYIESPEITGQAQVALQNTGGDHWTGDITNATGVQGGEHQVRVSAMSPNSSQVYLYDIYIIDVLEAEPIVIGIDPDFGLQAGSLAGVEISGSGFQGPGLAVILRKVGAPDIVPTNIAVLDHTLVTCDIDILQSAPMGSYDVIVINGNTKSDTAAGLFEVLCAAPIVTNINPQTGFIQSTIATATITGTNFLGPSVHARLKMAGFPDIVGYNVVLVNASTITCSFNIGCANEVGQYDVVVINDCGTTGTGEGLFSTLCPTPLLNAINPSAGNIGATLTGITLTGTNLICSGGSVILKRVGAPDIEASNIVVQSANQITFDLDIPDIAPLGAYNVQMTNGCGQLVVKNSFFTLTCPTPLAANMSTITADAGSTLSDVSITGATFIGPPTDVRLLRTSAPDIVATDINMIDPAELTCDFVIPIDAPTGSYTLRITNGCGVSGTSAAIFTVTCPAPTVSSIFPINWGSMPGAIINDAQITGSNFYSCGSVSSVYLDNGNLQIYGYDIKVLSNTTLTCDFNIASGPYDVGAYDVVVTTEESASGLGLFTIYNNLLFQQNFATGDGSCYGIGTDGGYYYTGAWWDSYNPPNQPYPTLMYSAFLTPEFDVPSIATDVHVSIRHSINTDILEGAFAGWTNNGGTTFYGDACDGVNRLYPESGQAYNGDNLLSPIYEGMGAYFGCANPVGWQNKYWLGSFGSEGGTIWSGLHCTGASNLLGMNNAQFMVIFVSDSYIENSRGHEISQLTIWYDTP